jgi:hypothetical protein
LNISLTPKKNDKQIKRQKYHNPEWAEMQRQNLRKFPIKMRPVFVGNYEKFSPAPKLDFTGGN